MEVKIEVEVDRKKSARTGTFEFGVPARLKYLNNATQSWEYVRAVKRPLKVLPRYLLIPLDPRRSSSMLKISLDCTASLLEKDISMHLD